jgi:hypothetical protein
MGMSTHIVGFRPPDAQWKKMKAVWDACKAAGTDIPKAVNEFFRWEEPDEAGVEVEFKERGSQHVVQKWGDDCRDGFEIDLEQLRKWAPQVTKIRFYNSY